MLIQGDMARPRDATRCVEQTVQQFGEIDLLVHSASGPVNGGLFDLTPEAWQNAFDVHIHAIFHLCRGAIPVMRKKKQGSIVLISSTAGIRGIRSNVAYQVVKARFPSSLAPWLTNLPTTTSASTASPPAWSALIFTPR